MFRLFLVFFLVISPFFSRADEGMWPPTLIDQAIFERMKALGFALTPEQLYSTSQSSLKDAVVLFGRGCTAEIISNQGLILTNHHCGFGQIQSHSSVEKDYLKNGFWAKTQSEELANPGLTASILVRMEDVTKQVLDGTIALTDEKEKGQKVEANIRKISADAVKGTHYQAQIKPFFGGLQYWVLVYETFTDVRLVGTPPSSIGKFGGDTDNWVWPRHTGDFCLFRIYAGKDNKPAPYAPDNKPFVPRKYFPINVAGIKEGDFTMVLGYPGRTMEYLPSFALKMVSETTNPPKIELRTRRLEIINGAMNQSSLNRIRYAAKQSDIANAWKKWKGELLGMKKANAVGIKQNKEIRYVQHFQAMGEGGKPFLKALVQLDSAYQDLSKIAVPFELFREAVAANDVFGILGTLKRMAPKKDEKWTDSLRNVRRTEFRNLVRSTIKDCDPQVERGLFTTTLQFYYKQVPARLHSPKFLAWVKKYPFENEKFEGQFFDKANILDTGFVFSLAEKVFSGKVSKLNENPAFQLYSELLDQYNLVHLPQWQYHNSRVERAQQVFLSGQMEMEKGRQLYPDANQTYRVAFGQVAGYQPQDGVKYSWQTTTAGIMEKSGTADDFILEENLQNTFKTQNAKAPVPVAFVASNHSTGGNSGSPVLNAKGELIGINFDRVWEGTMSDYFFDSRICRNITCDIRYVLWVIDTVGQSGHLIKEMELKN